LILEVETINDEIENIQSRIRKSLKDEAKLWDSIRTLIPFGDSDIVTL